MESTNELVTAAEARAEGLSLDGVADNRCITKQQFNDNLPSGGGIADTIDMLNSSIDGNTVLLFNNTYYDTSLTIQTTDMYGSSQSGTVELASASMVVYPIAGPLKIIKLIGNCVIGSNYHVGCKVNNVAVTSVDTANSGSTIMIGNNNLPLTYCLAVVCINNT